MGHFGISHEIIRIIESLYENSNISVILNNKTGYFFHTTVGVRQGCLLSTVLFNIFLEQIMHETLHNHKSTIYVGGMIINNLRFADDIDLIAGTNSELQEITNRLSEASKDYGMEVSKEKSKTMVNSKNESAKIMMDGTLLENVKTFKYRR